jgi:hypothetical protein
MYLFGKRANQLEAVDITRLVQNQVKESKTLDYKREFKLEDKDKREFLFDITSMFNTEGGIIVYGIEELKDDKKQNTGVPKQVTGISVENEDKLFQKIEDIVRSNTEPNICNLELKLLDVDGLTVLVIGISKGLGLPCMVTLNDTNKFYKRKNTGKYAVDVHELNQMFMQNIVLKESVEKFRYDRIAKVRNGKVFPNLEIETSFFCHLFPFSFVGDQIIDLSTVHSFEDVKINLRPLFATGWDYMFNLDGFATFATENLEDKLSLQSNKWISKITSYNQLIRNGVFEIYSSKLIYVEESNRKFLYVSHLMDVIDLIKNALSVQQKLNIEPPFYLCLSFHGILNGNLIYNDNASSNQRFKTDEIYLPAIMIQTYDADIKETLRPVFDILWQAVGFSKSNF